jgi:4-hydroxythreonine-4-phosphate dehydrogenase
MGDPSGVGAEIIALALKKVRLSAEFIVIGDKWVFEKSQKAKVKSIKYKFIDLENVSHKNFAFGKIRSEYGRASIEYLDKAMELIKKREIDCLVTAPISKEAINLAGFKYSGHTEYFAQKSNTKDFAMLLVNRQLKISLVTRHTPILKVPLELSKEIIYNTVRLTYKSLQDLFLIKKPRLVVCGLNPHASDNGLIGQEENRIIKPVLANLKNTIKHIDGPKSADIAILEAYQKKYDCVIAMYHDQALIPLKLLGKSTGVNLTLGLSFIRTSPLHGTAFDIAGTNLADPASLIEAIKLAARCTLNQRKA